MACDASTVRERRRYLWGEGGKYGKRMGPPLQEQRIDWAQVDWSKGNAALGRELGVSAEAVRRQRLKAQSR